MEYELYDDCYLNTPTGFKIQLRGMPIGGVISAQACEIWCMWKEANCLEPPPVKHVSVRYRDNVISLVQVDTTIPSAVKQFVQWEASLYRGVSFTLEACGDSLPVTCGMRVELFHKRPRSGVIASYEMPLVDMAAGIPVL